jgi:ABC-type Fe3+/spermidine/putrescine transport system ATPase subunit
MVFQSYALFPHLNVYENVAFGLKEQRRPKDKIEAAVKSALELVQLSGLEQRRARQLSGGQQQRVALARAIVLEPVVLLLDEPLGALDLKLRRRMQLELKKIQKQLKITFLYVTHDQEEALTMSDRIAVMRKGAIEQVGPPEEIYNRPANRYVANFVGEANILEGKVVDEGHKQVTLEVPGLGKVYGSCRSPVPPSTMASLIIRPERVDLAPADGSAKSFPEDRTCLTGLVSDIFFVGMYQKLVVQVASDLEIISVHPNRAETATIQVGDEVVIWWAAENAWVVTETSPVESGSE